MNTTRQANPLLPHATILLLAALLLSGCDKDNAYSLTFSHNLHVSENGMSCANCHGKMTAGRFSIPTHAACKECHGDWIETKAMNAETCGKCHASKDLKTLPPSETPPAPAANTSKLFVHTSALTNRCMDCHGAFMDKKLNRVPILAHKDKVRIRDQAHRWGLDCATCHTAMDRKTPPPNHRQNWSRLHGALGTQPDNACAMCHRDESCRECHQVTMPASHNNLWRNKTHGLQASFDRARCLVCHQQDSCEACHESNRPQSHNGNWEDRHCYACHMGPAAPNQCAVCHPGGNSVLIHQGVWPAGHENRNITGCHRCHPPNGPAPQ